MMQTCTQLRASLRPLLSKPMLCTVVATRDRIWEDTFKTLEHWRKGGSHKGRVTITVDLVAGSGSLERSTAAAIAGALEIAMYGRLSENPTVYVECVNYKGQYVSHKREAKSFREIMTLV